MPFVAVLTSFLPVFKESITELGMIKMEKPDFSARLGKNSRLSKNIFKILREGRGESFAFAAGEGNLEAGGMKEKAGGLLFPIDSIAEDGMAEVFEVDAELVGAAGDRF